METIAPLEGMAAEQTSNGSMPTSRKQPVLRPWLVAQSINLVRHTEALRPFRREEFGTGAEAPTDGHILEVNQLMTSLRRSLQARTSLMKRYVTAALRQPSPALLRRVVTHKHKAHAWVQAIERIWDFYFELFGQRQSRYGHWLVSCDRIALDCYRTTYVGLGHEKSIPAPPPFSYMRTGFGPATFRRGIPLRKLGRQLNPFPLIQLPYHRLVNPWTLGAVLHEVSHNLQSDLGLALTVPRRIARRLLKEGLPPGLAAVWTRWNREMFADLSGLLLGGPAVAASLMDVVGRAPQIVYSFSSRGVHPTPYLRMLLSTELLRRMGFAEEAQNYRRAWTRIYDDPGSGNFPEVVLKTAPKAIYCMVDVVCYQPYSELGNKSLAQVFRFEQKDQRMIEEAARRLGHGTDPGVVPERFLIGSARFALDNRLARPEVIKENFYKELARR
jgi:hypothetical protein